MNNANNNFYAAYVPHVPILNMQDKQANPEMWAAYDACVAEFDALDPELVIVFGGDHYNGVHLKMMPTFIVGQVAEAFEECGGLAGTLDIPADIAYQCAVDLMAHDFDIATSYAMEIDHGFTSALANFLHGKLDARPVLPIHINSMCEPRPSFKRCRQLGEAVGRFAKTLGKRVAFLGSGGLSHQTDFIFPQYRTAPNQEVRDYIVSGGTQGPISREQWMGNIDQAMEKFAVDLVTGEGDFVPYINEEWDRRFLDLFATGDLSVFDDWDEAEVIEAAGYGGGEIRSWIAAAAAFQAAADTKPVIDFYSAGTTIAVGAAVAHSSTQEPR